jgi:hypothetical protein
MGLVSMWTGGGLGDRGPALLGRTLLVMTAAQELVLQFCSLLATMVGGWFGYSFIRQVSVLDPGLFLIGAIWNVVASGLSLLILGFGATRWSLVYLATGVPELAASH